MSRADLLADTRKIIAKGIAEGHSAAQMKADLQTKLYKAGWWGPDPKTGKLRGSPYRIKTIIDTNLSTAFAAGRFKAQSENADDRPFWQYVAVMDSRTRAMHRAMHGKIYRFDDPIWKTHYPPNGFNCRCRVRALSAEDLEHRGLETAHPDDLAGFQPDLGWDHNPGLLWQSPDPNRNDNDGKWKAIPGQDTWDSKEYKLPDLQSLPRAKRPQRKSDSVEEALGLSEATPNLFIETPAGQILLTRERVAHITAGHRRRQRERYADYILPTLTEPNEVWITAYANGEEIEFRKSYIKVFKEETNSTGGTIAIVLEKLGEPLLLTFFPASDSSLNARRRGRLLYPKPKKKKTTRGTASGSPLNHSTEP